MSFPYWNPPTVSSRTKALEFTRGIVSTILNIQTHIKNAVGAWGNLENFAKTTRTSYGDMVTIAISHNNLANVGENDHHNRFHGTNHTAVDLVPPVTSTRAGLMTRDMFYKLQTIVTGANKKFIWNTAYIGIGRTTNLFLNYPGYPKIVIIWRVSANGAAWEAIPGVNVAIKHVTASTYYPHVYVTNAIRIMSTYVIVRGSTNVTDYFYRIFCAGIGG